MGHDTGSDQSGVNWAAVIASTIVYFTIGALWYSPLLFVSSWLRLIGKSFDEVKAHGNTPYGYAFLAALGISYGLARLVVSCRVRGPVVGALLGGGVALCFATAAAAPGYLFEMRPISLFAINAGYPIVGMTVSGLLLGAFNERRLKSE